jgi:hypothetical protein
MQGSRQTWQAGMEKAICFGLRGLARRIRFRQRLLSPSLDGPGA